jgi:hypothetical protein
VGLAWLFSVTSYKRSVDPIINPNPVSNHKRMTILHTFLGNMNIHDYVVIVVKVASQNYVSDFKLCSVLIH